jgi:HEPN domain-containing protein
MQFVKDPNDWLRKYSPHEWIRAAMGEMKQAEDALAKRNVRGAFAGCKRAAGMALNGALIVLPREGWGRTYVEHVEALSKDDSAPEVVREACRVVMHAQPPSGVVALRTPATDEKVMEAARDVIAHAYAIVVKHEA